MNNAFKKMTRSLAWIMTASLAVAFMLPSNAAAIEFFPNPVRYQWVSQNGTVVGDATTVYGNAGDTVAMSLTIKNRQIDPAAKVLYGKSTLLPEASPYQGAHELRLGVKDDAILPWIDSSSFLPNPDGAANRLAVYDGPAANVGENLTFSFNLKIASGTADGTYALPVGLLREFDAWARQVNTAGTLLPSSDIFWNVVVGAGGPITGPTGALSVALAYDTPVAASVADAGQANFTKFTMTAAAGTTIQVSQLFVMRDGLSTDAQLENVKLLSSEGVQIGGTAGGFNSDHRAQVFINPALSITGTQSFYIRAGVVSDIDAGVTFRLGLATNDAVVSNSTSVSGAPVWGNYMTCVKVAIGTLSVAEDMSVADTTPDIGDTDVVVNNFKITAGSIEGITVDRITVLKAGSTEVADTNNIELWDVTNSKTLGTSTSWTADGKASWPVNIVLGKGDTIRLRVQLDIVDGVGLTVNCDIADGTDFLVFGKGASYGFYITPTAATEGTNWTVQALGSNNLGQGDYNQTINSGAVTISKSSITPPTGNIAIADNQLLAVFAFDVKGESIRVSAVHVEATVADTSGGTPVATALALTNARLVDMATGNTLSGPVDGSADSTDPDEELDFTNTFTLPVGINNIGVKARLAAASGTTGFEALDTIICSIDAAGNVTTKGIITNNTITPTVSGATSNTLTVKAGALVIETLGVPSTGSVIVNAQDMVVGTYSFNAIASGEDVVVSAFTVTDDMDATTGESDDFVNWQLWADLTAGTNSPRGDVYETQISGTENPTSDAGDGTDTQAFTLTTPLNIPKGTSVQVVLVADVASGATALGTHIFETTNGTCASVSGKDTGTDIAESAAGLSIDATLTIAAAGSITTALADSNPDSALMIAGGANYTTIGAYKFTATNEPFTITKLTFDMSAGWESVAKLKISYPTKTGVDTREVSVSGAAIVFDNISMYVPKNGHAVVTASVLTKRIGAGTGGTYADIITLGIDMDATAEFAAIGENSGTALDGDSTGTTDRNALPMYLYNTIPTITATNPSGAGTIIPGGVVDLYKFNVTADAAGAVAVKRFTFSIFITDASTTTANTTDLGGFTFWRGASDITATAQITKISTDGGATHLGAPLTVETDDTNDIECNTSTWIQVTFANTPATDATGEQTIEAGQTVSYTLKATAGTGFTTTDAFSTTLLSDSVLVTDGYNYLSDVDTGTGVEQIVILQNAAGAQFGEANMKTTEQTKFLWSDKSVLAHLPTFDDTGVTETSSLDWTNGYLTKNTPTGYGYTL